MGEIKRADFTPYGMVEKDEGHYVYFTDHEAVVARLRAEVEENEKAINVWRGRTQRAEAEVEKYRTDAARWRFFQTAGFNVTLRMHYTRPDEREKSIDCAMGEGK